MERYTYRKRDPYSDEENHKFELLKTSWRFQYREFFDNSTLHGVRYIAEEGRHFLERFMWFCFCAIGATATSIIIVSLWEKFQTNPTITGLDTDFHNWDVVFPGITVCTEYPVSQERMEAYIAKKWPDASNDTLQEYRDFVTQVANLSYFNLHEFQKFDENKVKALKLPEDNLKEILYEVVERCDDLYVDCVWKGKEQNSCCEHFVPMFTENGFCFSFNAKFSQDKWPWLIGNWTRPQEYQIYETDPKWSMKFYTDVDKRPIAVYIHSYDVLPGVDMKPQHVWRRQIAKVSFAAKTTYTTEDARQLTIRQRRCVFDDEKRVEGDDKYSYSGCRRECRMHIARKQCHCVPFFYNITAGNYKVCNLSGLICLARLQETLMKADECKCELGCMNTIYEVEKLNDATSTNDSLEVGFVSWPMVRYKREVLFGWVDLLVSFGGIAGLFLGFSLLSGIEILYYFLMRAFCMLYRNEDELEELYAEYLKLPQRVPDLSLVPTFCRRKDKVRPAKKFTKGPKLIEGKPPMAALTPANFNTDFNTPYNLPYLP